jgi:NitT/TauT family transport system permease protein
VTRGSPAAVRIAIVVAAVAALEVACRAGWIKPLTLVAPSVMVERLIELARTAKFWSEVGATVRSIAFATLAAWIAGFVAGVALHGLPRVRRLLEPLVASYYALPFFVFYPLAVVLLGMTSLPIIVMGALFAVVSMMSATLIGLDRVPAVLDKSARAFRLDRMSKALYIQMPATLPDLFAGAKLSLGYAISAVIGSEFILSDRGIGYSIAYAYNDFDGKTMYAYLVFVILFVSAVLAVAHWIERRVRYRAGAGWTITAPPSSAASPSARAAQAMLLFAIVLALWQLVYLVAGSEAMASPAMTAHRLSKLFESPRFWQHAAETGRALAWALVIAWGAGAVAGVLLGASRRASEVAEPMVVALQSTPKVTLYPVMLLVFGLGMAAKVAFGVMHGIIPMTLFTMNAIRNVNPALLRTARVMRLTRLQTATTVLMPAVTPEIVTAARLSFSITLLGVIVGELFASQRGLGFLIMSSIAMNDVATIMSVTVLVVAFALSANALLLAIDKRVQRGGATEIALPVGAAPIGSPT